MEQELREFNAQIKKALEKFSSQEAVISNLQERLEAAERRLVDATERINGQRRPDLGYWDTEAQALEFVEFCKAVSANDQASLKQMSEGVDADGGYLVPTEFLPTLIRIIENYGVARRSCTVIPMSRMEMEIPALSAGVTVYWVGENNPITASQPTFGQVVLTAKKLAALVPSSNELLEDSSIAIANLLVQLIGEAMAEEEDRVCFAGDTGSADPFDGVLVDANTTSIVMAGSAFTDMDGDDLADMIAALTAGQIRGAQFYMHRTIFNIVRKLKSTDGHYIYSPPNGQDPATIWGFPYELIEVMPAVTASAGDTPFVIFGNLRHYYLGDRRRATLATSQHVGFANDQMYFRVITRLAFAMAVGPAFAVLRTAVAQTTTTS